jgi:cell division protein FtsB
MRLLLIVLVLLTAITQYPLWWGKGGWLRVHELEQKVANQQDTNQALIARNNALQAEVDDLKSGTQAIEERARGELSLVKPGEAFVQILPPHKKGSSVSTPELASPKEKPGN